MIGYSVQLVYSLAGSNLFKWMNHSVNSHPDEVWDTCFTNQQFLECVKDVSVPTDVGTNQDFQHLLMPQEQEIEDLWTDDFTDMELIQAAENMEKQSLQPNISACFDLNSPIVISSDDNEPPVQKKSVQDILQAFGLCSEKTRSRQF